VKKTIDTKFNVYSETPEGGDPDRDSPTLRAYHKQLWSKPLPNGGFFQLDTNSSGAYLRYKSAHGDLILGSDAITNSFCRHKRLASLINQVPPAKVKELFDHGSTISAYTIFPSKQIGRKYSINQARGIHSKIGDRFDLTLECIRRFYLSEENPLNETLCRYSRFFELFGDFKGYVDFFLLNDLVADDYSSINFYLNFSDFDASPFPKDVQQYLAYSSNTIDFINARSRRIALSQQSENVSAAS